jgi:FAD/FMN-containing dehydrogenase
MIIRIPDELFRQAEAAADGAGPLQYRIGRRGFVGSALAAATLPLGRAWADASDVELPERLSAVGLDGKQITIARAEIKEFRASLRGQLLLAGNDGYEQARQIWNGVFDRHPALIARCAGSDDVVKAVNFARAHGVLTAVRGGGHSISGQSSCEGGLMIDLALMKEIHVDAAKMSAQAQGGVLLGDFDRESQALGLVTTLGTASDTGIAGLTLGGGLGRLQKKFGLACDNLISADIVTADGKTLHVSAHENPDLFWGIRGGGGNFGVVTRFEYRLHKFGPNLLAGNRAFPIERAKEVIPALLELMSGADDDVNYSFGLTKSPPPGQPEGSYVEMELIYTGDLKRSDRVLASLDKLGKPAFDDIAVKPYLKAQLGVSGAAPRSLPPGLRIYSKSGFVYGSADKMLEEMLAQFAASPKYIGDMGIGPMGGAVGRVKPDATAFWNRKASLMVMLHGAWVDPALDAPAVEGGRHIWQALEPYTRGHYVNAEPGAEGQRLRDTYGDSYPRLVKLKNKVDPTNLFRLNSNIKPTVA